MCLQRRGLRSTEEKDMTLNEIKPIKNITRYPQNFNWTKRVQKEVPSSFDLQEDQA